MTHNECAITNIGRQQFARFQFVKASGSNCPQNKMGNDAN